MKEPFGLADCESELRKLRQEGYSALYFGETPFNQAAVEEETYLIVGRRGSGKTALSQYFSFGETFKNPILIDVDQPALYQRSLTEVAAFGAGPRDLAIHRLQRIWYYLVWSLIAERMRHLSPEIERACEGQTQPRSLSEFIGRKLESLVAIFKDPGDFTEADLNSLLTEQSLERARPAILSIARERPVIIAIDTLERYDRSDEHLMNALAGLIRCAAEFNGLYAEIGIHLKVFMSGEVFPHLKEVGLQNTLKDVKHPVYLLWRPRDLLRLICWRFYRYLKANNQLDEASKGEIDWTNPGVVMQKMWRPYFGSYVTNGRGLREQTFTYVLRHTQLRPRQLILVCNAIAQNAIEEGRFPHASETDIRVAVRHAEGELAAEIINSFTTIYPKVEEIVNALLNIPMVFSGNELDRRAYQSKRAWPGGSYSPAAFHQLVAELGVVGRVTRSNDEHGYIDADFEYSLMDRLRVTEQDQCVIHPMFYSRLNVRIDRDTRIMPFSTSREHPEVVGL
jgi:hypothetical protein